MHARLSFVAVAIGLLAGCSRESWPEPPAVEPAEYQKQHASWRAEQHQMLSSVLPILGIWPLEEGDTAFGSDKTLPIALPAAHFPARAGAVRRAGDRVTVIPAADATLRLDDGSTLDKPAEVETFIAGPVRLTVASAGDDRRWLMAMDESHPAVKDPPVVDTFPLDAKWRVAARFDAFEKPKNVHVPDVRGGTMQFAATGALVFRIDGQEMRLMAFGEPGSEDFFVLFKDPTNETTTFSGYRMLAPKVVKDGEWTVIDFNFAMNPPCAYSKYTICPLPPPENKLPVAIEAGLKRLSSVRGYAE